MEYRILKPQNLFLLLCLVAGMAMVFINPPFQTSDEGSHFYKIYGYVEGSLNFKKITVNKEGRSLTFSGQILPSGIVRAVSIYGEMSLDAGKKTSFNKTVKMLSLPLEKDKKVFIAYPVPFYMPFAYFLSVPLVWVLSLFNSPPLFMLYACRLCSLLTYAVIVYYAIKIVPFKKHMFAFIGLLPMAVYTAASVSADGMTNALALLFCAYVFMLAYKKETPLNECLINKKQMFILCLIFFLLMLCKFAYFPLVFMFFLIPSERFKSHQSRYLSFCVLFGLGMIQVCFLLVYHMFVTQGIVSFASTLDKTELFIKAVMHPLSYMLLVFRTILINGFGYLVESIGSFGWDTVKIPPVFAAASYAVLFAGAVVNCGEQALSVRFKDRIILIISALLSVFVTMSVCYLLFTYMPAQKVIDNFQGRYLLPLLPLGLVVFSFKKFCFKTNVFRYFTVIVSCILMIVSAVEIVKRFYI